MTDKEVNKIIAEFMNESFCQCIIFSICPSPSSHHNYCINKECKKIIDKEKSYQKYTQSLDALVPVWEKLPTMDYHIQHLLDSQKPNIYTFYFDDFENNIKDEELACEIESSAPTIQQAAAHATAKAILELKGE